MVYGRGLRAVLGPDEFQTLVRTWMVAELAARESLIPQAKVLLATRCQTLREAVQAFLFPDGMKPAEIARRVDSSVRTVYRDVDALSAAGVPVRTEPGPHGGIELIGGWRTDLTGLTEPELYALFTSAAGPAFESAMGKLAAALPGETGRRAGRMRERLLVDSAGWGRRGAASPRSCWQAS